VTGVRVDDAESKDSDCWKPAALPQEPWSLLVVGAPAAAVPSGKRPDGVMDVCHLSGSRKRISVSCERLRALLPQFDGRREDMVSILEMAVEFLQLVHTTVPGWEQHSVSCQ
jgi:hypothetical protein